MAAFLIGLLTAVLTLFLWFGLMTGIGFITDSGPFGICGPHGNFGGMLFLMFLLTPIVSIVGGIVCAHLYVKKKSKPGSSTNVPPKAGE